MGTTAESGTIWRVLVLDILQISIVSYLSMLLRSKVKPSQVITGSSMTSWEMGQRYADGIENDSSGRGLEDASEEFLGNLGIASPTLQVQGSS